MAATLVLSVKTGASTGSWTDNVTGIDMESADNALNSIENRQANPITVGTNSYEKWIALKITVTPQNYVRSFQVWFNSSVAASTTLYFTGQYVTYQQGTTAASGIAGAVATSYTSGNKAIWDLTTYTAANTGSYTKFLVLQLAVGATAGPGTWTQQTVNYSYDEA
jgi:Tfp pilus assembly protein PilX